MGTWITAAEAERRGIKIRLPQQVEQQTPPVETDEKSRPSNFFQDLSDVSSALFTAIPHAATFGFLDEILGALPGVDKQALRERMSEVQSKAPITHFAGEVLGGALPAAAALASGGAAAVPLTYLAGGVRGAPTFSKMALAGSLSGALYGAGTANDDLDDRINQALTQGGTGAVFGPILGKAAQYLGPKLGSLISGKKASEGTAAEQIAPMIKGNIEEQFQSSIPRFRERLESPSGIYRSTQRDVLAETMPSLRQEIVDISRGERPLHEQLTQYAARNLESLNQGLQQDFTKILGVPSNFNYHSELRALETSASDISRSLYDQALAKPFSARIKSPITGKMQEPAAILNTMIEQSDDLRSVFNHVINSHGTRIASGEAAPLPTLGMQKISSYSALVPKGGVEPIEPTRELVHDMVQELSHRIESFNLSGNDLRTLLGLRKKLQQIAGAGNKAYEKANMAYKAELDKRDMLKAGVNAFSGSFDENVERLNRLRDESKIKIKDDLLRSYYRQGFISSWLEHLSKSPNPIDTLSKQLSTKDFAKKLDDYFGSSTSKQLRELVDSAQQLVKEQNIPEFKAAYEKGFRLPDFSGFIQMAYLVGRLLIGFFRPALKRSAEERRKQKLMKISDMLYGRGGLSSRGAEQFINEVQDQLRARERAQNFASLFGTGSAVHLPMSEK